MRLSRPRPGGSPGGGVGHQQGTFFDAGEHARLEGQLHYLVGAEDLGHQDVAAGLRQQSRIHN